MSLWTRRKRSPAAVLTAFKPITLPSTSFPSSTQTMDAIKTCLPALLPSFLLSAGSFNVRSKTWGGISPSTMCQVCWGRGCSVLLNDKKKTAGQTHCRGRAHCAVQAAGSDAKNFLSENPTCVARAHPPRQPGDPMGSGLRPSGAWGNFFAPAGCHPRGFHVFRESVCLTCLLSCSSVTATCRCPAP